MAFNEKLPEWNATGVEPPTSKKNEGWQPDDKPPADWFNWLFNRAYKVLDEIRTILGGHVDAAAPHSGHETPAGATAKASAAETNAKNYTDTHAGAKDTHGAGAGYYIAKTSRSDQLPAYADVQGKPPSFPPSTHTHPKSEISDFPTSMPPSSHKSTHASGGSDALSPADIGAATAAQGETADTAASDLATHLADIASHVKPARIVIGTSTAGWTAKDCHYLCDGTNDQEEINNAITALPATGGEIVILDGTYNITAKIDVTKDNVNIRGNGNATILKRMFNSSVKEGVITLTSRSGCKIASLQIDGDKANYNNSNNYGIYLASSSDNTVTGNACNNNSYGISLYSSNSNNTVTGNTCNNNSYGIYLNASNNNNTVTGNTCNNNDLDICLDASSSDNTVTGNTCSNSSFGIYLSSSSNNTVTGNTCSNSSFGIYLDASSNNTVTGNTCSNSSFGIYLDASSNNTVTGNTCIRGTGLATDYTASQHTIRLKGTDNNYNLISNNNCMGKAPTIEGGTGNTLVNNKFDAT